MLSAAREISMHKILERQLQKVFGSLDAVPKNLAPFLQMVDEVYTHSDEDSVQKERSFEAGSKELEELNRKLNEQIAENEKTKLAILNLLEDLDREKKSAEELVVIRTQELRNEKARLLASINSLSLGFIIADTNNIVILKNPALSFIFDLKEEPQSIEDVAKHLDKVSLSELSKECVRANKVIERTDVPYGKKVLRILCAPVVDEGRVTGYVFLVDDITEAKVIERSREEFFAVASHELRTPLTAIRGNVEMMLDLYADKIIDKDMHDMLIDINESSVRLIDIVNDFLEVSRLEQGKIEIKAETFSMDEVILKVIRDLQGVINKKGLSISYESPQVPLPSVRGDKNKTEQVLVNLVGNSMKFTREGSITVRSTIEGKYVKVLVSDTGIGISEHNQTLLFRKFQQAGEKMLARDVTQSTGLGLYISKLLMTNMAGQIWLESSELGKGSTFAFTLPIAS